MKKRSVSVLAMGALLMGLVPAGSAVAKPAPVASISYECAAGGTYDITYGWSRAPRVSGVQVTLTEPGVSVTLVDETFASAQPAKQDVTIAGLSNGYVALLATVTVTTANGVASDSVQLLGCAGD